MTTRQLVHTLLWAKRHLRRELPEPEAERLRRVCKPTDVCIDVGAHSGSWTVALAHLVPDGQVVALEALPYYAEVLRATLHLLRCPNVIVLNHAATATEGPVQLAWQDPSGRRLTGHTHIAARGEAVPHPVVVEGLPLDRFMEGAPFDVGRLRFIKMDIEGAELPALRGAHRLLRESRPLLYLEVWREHTTRYGYQPADLFAFLASHGYSPWTSPTPAEPLRPLAPNAYTGQDDLWFLPAEADDDLRQAGFTAP